MEWNGIVWRVEKSEKMEWNGMGGMSGPNIWFKSHVPKLREGTTWILNIVY